MIPVQPLIVTLFGAVEIDARIMFFSLSNIFFKMKKSPYKISLHMQSIHKNK